VKTNTPNILIVTPAKNEALTLPFMAKSLSEVKGGFIGYWAIIENASSDDTFKVAQDLKCTFPTTVVSIESSGDLSTAPEFKAFLHAAAKYFQEHESYSHIMKLDADVILDPDYFVQLFSSSEVVGMAGGPLAHEQSDTIPGAVKLYSREAFNAIRDFPIALGFDVLDEVAVRRSGLPIEINQKARFKLLRETSSSQGRLKGRSRAGQVCRWSGYSKIYFLLRLVRYTFKPPIFTGAVLMLIGYLTAGGGPFDKNLKNDYREFQLRKLISLLRNPLQFIRLYYSSGDK
jgi:hypothetical protein